VDFSEASKRAVTYGLTLAIQYDAHLLITHIVPESSSLTYAFSAEMLTTERKQYEEASAEIGNLVPREFASRVRLQTIVRIGSIEEELLRIVKDEAVNLVVMGTHGRRYLGRWFIGSVTEHILRKVPVPVLTVSQVDSDKHAIGMVPLKRILYATGLSESPSTGLKLAIGLAREVGAQLTVLHVVDDEGLTIWGSGLLTDLDVERAKVVQEMRKKLDDLLLREKPQGMRIEALVVEGKPFRKIVEIADDRRMDIIVLNLQSMSVLERALLGSTAERVVRLAGTPVLSVPVGVAH
jgi:nucleotide-binding universal stress UspA family protein